MPITFSKLGNYGRLGNAMFQIATTVGLAKRNNDDFLFPHWKYESYFNLPECFSNNIQFNNTYEEPSFHFTEIKYSPNLNIAGYFQSFKYFDDCSDYIKKIFTPKSFIDNIILATSIHVRRADYLKCQEYHNVLDMEYYNNAMALCPSSAYIIFSDDIEWCKQNFIGKQFIFIENNHEVKDLNLMSNCENNIIANSSFSLWAAWLNRNTKKKIIAPKKWFGSKLEHNTKDLIPDNYNWIRI